MSGVAGQRPLAFGGCRARDVRAALWRGRVAAGPKHASRSVGGLVGSGRDALGVHTAPGEATGIPGAASVRRRGRAVKEAGGVALGRVPAACTGVTGTNRGGILHRGVQAAHTGVARHLTGNTVPAHPRGAHVRVRH